MDNQQMRPASPGMTTLQKHNLSRAAISLNSMRYDSRINGPFQRPGTNQTQASVSQRCLRLQGKINEIQETLKTAKSGRAVEYQRQISQLENIFEEAFDQAKRKFDSIDGQLSNIVDFLDVERRNKAQQLSQRKAEIAQRQQMLTERFANIARTREEVVKRTTDAIWEKEELLKSDIEKERSAREKSLQVIKECVQQDFPHVEAAIQREVQERETADSAIAGSLEQNLLELSKTAERMTDEREDQEVQLVESFKEMLKKIQGEIQQERIDRENAEEALLTLMESTCAKLSKQAQM